MVKIEAQRKVGIGSLQVHVEQAVDGSLYLCGIILKSTFGSFYELANLLPLPVSV